MLPPASNRWKSGTVLFGTIRARLDRLFGLRRLAAPRIANKAGRDNRPSAADRSVGDIAQAIELRSAYLPPPQLQSKVSVAPRAVRCPGRIDHTQRPAPTALVGPLSPVIEVTEFCQTGHVKLCHILKQVPDKHLVYIRA